jgi:hypothetical protein
VGVGDTVRDGGRDEERRFGGILCVDVGAEGREKVDRLRLAKPGGAE